MAKRVKYFVVGGRGGAQFDVHQRPSRLKCCAYRTATPTPATTTTTITCAAANKIMTNVSACCWRGVVWPFGRSARLKDDAVHRVLLRFCMWRRCSAVKSRQSANKNGRAPCNLPWMYEYVAAINRCSNNKWKKKVVVNSYIVVGGDRSVDDRHKDIITVQKSKGEKKAGPSAGLRAGSLKRCGTARWQHWLYKLYAYMWYKNNCNKNVSNKSNNDKVLQIASSSWHWVAGVSGHTRICIYKINVCMYM